VGLPGLLPCTHECRLLASLGAIMWPWHASASGPQQTPLCATGRAYYSRAPAVGRGAAPTVGAGQPLSAAGYRMLHTQR
jgi:hypothetical protein